ncbi:GNAT family N-acetyltransferase [Psychroflexus aestuariivivens]|uniref:GNAT family N-acetyltransferase n=1 Tax=Psychroflexus aestuariivivens TaxID=1795040 RepID=UPI000FDA21E9|nr:GNAT family N-acetyltransferase [Psychroflexus aestuariivivens]
MDFKIRFATPEDLPQILDLIKELAAFEKESDAVKISVKDLKTYGFGDSPLFKCFVAEVDQKVVGMALFYSRFSTWKGKTVHLEDLIVTKSMRGKSIGKTLFEAVVIYAKTQKIKRVEWVVLDWNIDAIGFYEKYGAKVFKDWRTVQLDEDQIKNFN